MNAYDCPQCRSRNTQTFKSVYAQNMRHLSGGGNRNYQSWNQLAVQTAPPEQPYAGYGANLLVCLATVFVTALTAGALFAFLNSLAELIDSETKALIILGATMFTGGVTFIGGLLAVSRKVQKQMPDYYREFNEWQRSILCRRCGYMWLRDN